MFMRGTLTFPLGILFLLMSYYNTTAFTAYRGRTAICRWLLKVGLGRVLSSQLYFGTGELIGGSGDGCKMRHGVAVFHLPCKPSCVQYYDLVMVSPRS